DPALRLLGRRGVLLRPLLLEAFDASCSIHQTLLARVVRVADRADFDVNRVRRAARLPAVAARALDGDFLVIRMNAGLHRSSRLSGRFGFGLRLSIVAGNPLRIKISGCGPSLRDRNRFPDRGTVAHDVPTHTRGGTGVRAAIAGPSVPGSAGASPGSGTAGPTPRSVCPRAPPGTPG